MERMLWYTGSDGLTNTQDPIEVKYDPQIGISLAKICYNIDFSRNGRMSRRKGWMYTDVVAASHSLYCDGGMCLFVSGDALCVLNEDFTYTAIRNVTTGREMKYEQIGSRVYYTNGSEIGYVLNGASYQWSLPAEVYGIKDGTKVLSPPPLGSNLAYFNGKMFIIQNYLAWHSKSYDVNVFDMTGNYLAFESAITMFRPVLEGIWVGTSAKVAFLRGTGPENFKYEKKALFGVIPGTATEVDCASIGSGEVSGVGIIFSSSKGAYLGTENGRLIPLTDKKLELPSVVSGAGIYMKDRYIASLGTQYDTSKLSYGVQLDRLAPTQYINFNFNSFCKFGRYYLGANENGIFKLDVAQRDMSSASSSVKIDAKYESFLTDFGIRTDKKIRKCRVSLETNGQIALTVTCNEGNAVTTQKIPFSDALKEHYIEVPVGRDVKGRFFTFSLENINGADFSVDDIEAFLYVLKRKPEREGAN